MASTPKRPYRKGKRAQSEAETRLRITRAAVELHGTVGPANTTVTDVAERAGVSRMTVYNHFPTDGDLFVACSTHWSERNPFPDPSAWVPIADPSERLVHALRELYVWYGLKEGMLDKVFRDAPVVPALGELWREVWGSYVEAVVSTLAHGWPLGDKATSALRAMLPVAVDFNTWRVLIRSGTDTDRAAALAADMVVGAICLRDWEETRPPG